MDKQRVWEKLGKKKRLRFAAVALCFSLLVTSYSDLWAALSVFAAEVQENGENSEDQRRISGFEELPEDVREQTVPLGTPVEELILPNCLEAHIIVETNDDGEGKEDADENENRGDGYEGGEENPGGEQDSGGEGDGSSGEENPDSGDEDGADEIEDSDGAENPEGENGDVTQNPDGDDGSPDEEEHSDGDNESMDEEKHSDGDADSTNADETSDDDDEGKPAKIGVQTGFFVLPAYQSENMITVETLEHTRDDFTEDTQSDLAEEADSEETVRREKTVTIEDITWQSDPVYDGDTEGTYVFAAILPEEYVLVGSVSLPQIVVTVQAEVQPAVRSRSMARAAAGGDLRSHTDHNGWQKLSAGQNMTGGNYYMDADISGIGCTVKSGQTVNLCLKGHTYQAWSGAFAIKVESGAVLNLYDCQENGEICAISNGGNGISATGTGASVNLYDGTVQGNSGNGVSLADGAQLLVDGAEVRNCITANPTGAVGVIQIGADSSATILSGRIVSEVKGSFSNNAVIYIGQNGKLFVEGGTLEGEIPGGLGTISASSVFANENTYIEINGGDVNTQIRMDAGTLSVDDTEIGGRILLWGGILQLGHGQSIGAMMPEMPAISISKTNSVIELTSAFVWQGGYTIQFSSGVRPSTAYPKTITKNFSTYMPDKQPGDCFTYLSSGEENDYYKMILSEGEVVLLPYVMTFDVNGGKPLEDSTDRYQYITNGKGDITGGLYMRTLPTPVREGYSCDGWYTRKSGGEKIDLANNRPHEDMTVYAHWTPVEYDITYDLAGGSLPAGKTNPETYTIESADFTLVNPVRAGYTFAGWSGTGLTGSANKTVKVPKGSMEERTYTAHWKADAYKVTLNGNGGSGGTALTGYDYGAGATLPTDWEKPGYTFAGWYADADCAGTAITEISATETGDKTFYAKWTANRYTVTFDDQGATGGSGTATKEVAYDSIYGTLPSPEKSGYAFKGWYTQAGGKGTQVTSQTKMTTEGDHTLYAYWKDETKPAAPVLQSGTTLLSDWTKTQQTIPLTLSDGVGVTKLWVSVDGGAYQEVTGFTNSNSDATVNYTFAGVTEGTHTYRFQAEDGAGNKSPESALFTVKLDTAKPVIGALSYTNKADTLWQWIIGKKSLIITVPVTDTGSGVTQISYTMTPTDAAGNADGPAETKTAPVKNGTAEIAFAEAFRGKILISCTDAAGNAADDVTVDAREGAKGVIVEDRAPAITALADRNSTDMAETAPDGTALSEDYYDSAPVIIVTVKDDAGNAISAGVKSVTYRVGDAAEKGVTVGTGTLQTEVTFRIPASEIPTGSSVVQIVAADHAGNQSTKSFTIKARGPEGKPAAVIAYQEEKLTGLVPDAAYLIDGVSHIADENGCISIEDGWMDTTIAIVKKGNGQETTDSEVQNLSIPARPPKPTPAGADVAAPGGTGKLTGLAAGVVYEISTDGGRTWKNRAETANENGEITGLAPGNYTVRVKAGASNFAGEKSDPAKIGAYQVKVTFMANGEKYREVSVDYGSALTDIPSVPPKKDAGDQLHAGDWCSDEQGTPADFTNITADMTVYAVYTAVYTVTLQGGTGCTLTAVSGSVSPVKAGGSFAFQFTLSSGYEKTGSFAVKVNSVAVTLNEDRIYTITDIAENKTVTVEGVRKKASSGNSGGSGKDRDKDKDQDTNPGGDNADTGDGGGQPGGEASTGSNPPAGHTAPTEGKKPGDTTPENGKKTGGADDENSGEKDGRKPGDADGEKSGGTDEKKPGGEDDKKPGEDDKKPGGAEGKQPGDDTPPTGEPQIVQVRIENGKIVVSDGISGGTSDGMEESGTGGRTEGAYGEAGETGILAGERIFTGTADGLTTARTILQQHDEDGNPTGAVLVTVVCEEQAYITGVADTVAVANAVLTHEELALVGSGETIEIRIDVTDISENVPPQDQEIIASGMETYREELPGLTLGMYVDISMLVKIGAGEWNIITETDEPVEVVLGIPEKLLSGGREFYIIRAHNGGYALMSDLDDTPETITISTGMFSSYAIAYAETESAEAGKDNGGKCGLCHICPTFFGICCFIWMAVIAAVILVVVIAVLRGRKEKDSRQTAGK